MMIFILLLLVLLLCYNIKISSSSKFIPRLEYISYISKTLGSYSINYNGTTTTKHFLSLMKSDDSPFEEFILPFSFPYFGSDIHRIYVSPNGAIHTDLNQPCPMCNCFGDARDCSMSSSYYRYSNDNEYVDVGYANVIGGILYDLLPANSTTYGNISATYSNTAVTIVYDKIKVYGSAVEYTFDITLINDGSIVINYGTIATSNYPLSGFWSTGMRGPRSTKKTSDNFVFPYANLTQSQINLKTIWNTKFYGLYPNTTIVGGKYFIICPMSMTWTATTVNIDSTNYDNINFKPILLGCSSIFALGNLTIGIYLDTNPSVVETCTYNSTNKWFNCKLSPVLINPTTTTYDVRFKWKENTHSPSWSNMNANPIIFNYGSTLNSSICAINDYTTSSCNACSIHDSNNFTCFNLPCSQTELFSQPDCNGGCWTNTTPDYNYYLPDIFDSCCAVSDIDCSGTCFGTQSTGYGKLTQDVSSMTVAKCCEADCTGVCGGTVVRDACGVCGGTDNLGKTCSTFVSINTGHTSNNIYANMSALTSDKPLVTYVNITNGNATSIKVKFQITGSSSFLGPEISVVKSTTTVAGNSSMLFTVNTSLNSMINGDINNWEVKKLYIKYSRPLFSDYEYSYSVKVYPTTENCSAVTNRNTCMRLPGCIFCYSYPAIRVLEEVDSPTFDNDNSGLWRRLFTNIMAEQAGVRTYSLSVGSCTDGWNTDDCPVSSAGMRFQSLVDYNVVIFTSFMFFMFLFS